MRIFHGILYGALLGAVLALVVQVHSLNRRIGDMHELLIDVNTVIVSMSITGRVGEVVK